MWPQRCQAFPVAWQLLGSSLPLRSATMIAGRDLADQEGIAAARHVRADRMAA